MAGNEAYELVGRAYGKPSEVPKDADLFYKCEACGDFLPSVPADNTSCRCGAVYIDKDYWRLVVTSFDRFSVWRRA